MNMAWDRDISKATGSRAVKNSLLGIITTRKGSRPFNPEFGCELSDQLFENMTPLTADTTQRNIISAIRNFEPRIDKLLVDVTPLYDSYTLIVTVQFSIIDNPDTVEQIKLQLSNSAR
ncbi:baseplate wedge subunit [Escherichia phage EcS1]|uniref:Baseplate wedge subunit n=1 Tax=Escherichia phage EcS1 TaxID=2083276 RepID=A0A2Z5ZCQ4_9CAUD|nr:baseplate wedge subunit [Escherichia phage EcS1]BBC78254.1 Baseplate wedge subunit [Escherichia phage EcS1]